MKLLESIASVFNAPAVQKFFSRVTSRSVVAPIVYSLLCMTVFAVVYILLGYRNHFETTDENKDKNVENSINASIMLQTNAMGSVTPTTSTGRWLMSAQVLVGWTWFMVVAALIL